MTRANVPVVRRKGVERQGAPESDGEIEGLYFPTESAQTCMWPHICRSAWRLLASGGFVGFYDDLRWFSVKTQSRCLVVCFLVKCGDLCCWAFPWACLWVFLSFGTCVMTFQVLPDRMCWTVAELLIVATIKLLCSSWRVSEQSKAHLFVCGAHLLWKSAETVLVADLVLVPLNAGSPRCCGGLPSS